MEGDDGKQEGMESVRLENNNSSVFGAFSTKERGTTELGIMFFAGQQAEYREIQLEGKEKKDDGY